MARSELSVPARLYRGFPWLLACCGAVGAYLLMSGSTYLAVAELVLTIAHRAGVDIADPATLATFDLWFQFGSQLASALLFWLWWRILTPRQVSYARRGLLRRDAASIARRLVALALLGVVVQMLVSVVLTLMVSLLPQVMQNYRDTMEAAGTTDFSLITVLVVGLGAPLLEETMCRGVLLEFALRAVCPEWRAAWRRGAPRDERWRARSRRVPAARFWLANGIQAALFGLLHGNIVQTCYAFLIGLALGALFWRTGRLRYNMMLHGVVNIASYAVNAIWGALAGLGLIGMVVVLVAMGAFAVDLYRAGTVAFAGALPAAGETEAR